MQSPTSAIGIDLGTLNSCVAVFQQSTVKIINNNDGNKVIPSYVAFTSTGRLLTGDAAKHQIVVNSHNTIFGVKTLLGRRFDESKITQIMKHRPFHIGNDNGWPIIQVDWSGETMYLTPEEISAMLLTNLKKMAENELETCVRDAVISVPVFFNYSQRQATKDAATIAGLNVIRIISEPVATALAYRFFDNNINEQKNVLIFCLGGESTEVSIISFSKEAFEIKATAYDQGFGGSNFDNRLVKHLTNEFKRKFKIDISPKSNSVHKLQSAAEQAKHTLSSSMEAEINIDALEDDINFYTKVSRSKFEELCSDLFSKTLCPVKKALNDAKLQPSFIDNIILVGGSTRIPKIQSLLQNYFPGKTLHLPTNPEETVAHGAAVLAAVLSGDTDIQNVSELFTQDGSMSLVGLDVTPLSLSIETAGGKLSKVFRRNTKMPCEQTRSFTTTTDNQRDITIQVYEGERAVSAKNNLLCTIKLEEIVPAPRGVPKFDVTFSVDANGILKVTAEEISSQISKSIVIQNRRLSREEVNKMAAKEAERCKKEDSG